LIVEMPTEFLIGQLELFTEAEMGKVESRGPRPEFFAKGGDGKMYGKGSAGPAESGTSGKESNDLGGGKWAKGGSGKMFGKGSAKKAESGQSGKTSQ
jgi:hypothetical protein